MNNDSNAQSSKASLLYDPVARSIFFQCLTVAIVAWLVYAGINNAITNLEKANVASGFGFLSDRSGFDVSQSLIEYTNDSSYLRAFYVGLTNTLLVSALGIFFATIIGFAVGIGRLSQNYLIRKICMVYVELLRNIPLLLQLLFWYKAVLGVLPNVRDAMQVGNIYLSNRGLAIPKFIPEAGASTIFWAFVVGIIATFVVAKWAKKRQMKTGQQFPTILVGFGLVLGLPLLALIVLGFPFVIENPELGGFNFRGGSVVLPEFVALLLGLALYTAAFIAEIVRSGILAVSKGQTEAAYALGIRPNITMRKVIVPQAMRVVIPPLTSQYLNLTKNSSLAVAIGYPDLVAIFSGTVLNQTGQAVEVVLMTMLVYLFLSLVTSTFMNWFNSRVSLVER
ncbi:amino acid ABC transporter permease [Ahrensia marina]|uniref:Amino acid ABC transporter permease n=1 Tax=Ahrensia marina TaxID=1514904 RepID=A0A0N0E6L3_9HYPH|nr:amino acid ABC transporter permease [Ahrensia marina]KPB00151.1 amino acid ABC transporter permease [Ahrensia marina]